MKQPLRPVLVTDLFPELLERLLSLLAGLPPSSWALPTACTGWLVHDVALHLLGDDLGLLSRRRDGHRLPSPPVEDWDSLVALINRLNAGWLSAARRISPPLTIDLLRFSGEQVNELFRSLDPFSMGGPVSWAGPEPAPVWLDVAREYTERWHHQQHIREAVGKPGMSSPRYLKPVLETFLRALPHSLRAERAAEGACLHLAIRGPAGGSYCLERQSAAWALFTNCQASPLASVTIGEDDAWRLFTKGLSPDQVRGGVQLSGDESMAQRVLQAVAIIA